MVSLRVDELSFGFINLLHARHLLPMDYASRWQDYVKSWAQRTVEEYYAVDPAMTAAAQQQFQASRHGGRVRWPSPIRTGLAENDHAVFDVFPCTEGWSAPTMFLAHGLMSVSDVGYRRWARALNAQGWNAIFAHLPYHYSRRPRGYWTGELAIGSDIIRVAEGVRQSVVELRMCVHWLASEGCQKIGAWGTSYGGWIAALLACVEERLTRLILIEPVLDIQDAIWNGPSSIILRQRLRSRGITAEQTMAQMRFCGPLHLQPKLPGSSVLLLAGAYDRISPPERVRRFQEVCAGAQFHVFPQGHVGYRLMPESWRLAQELWPEDFTNKRQHRVDFMNATAIL